MSESSDRELLDVLRRSGPLTVAEMARRLSVTGTAVRNRLSRLLATGLVERKPEHGARGRPRHRYQASVEAHKRLGQNYADLAVALWEEMMASVADRKLRRLLFTRITDRLADVYRTRVTNQEWEGRLVQLSTILHDRGVEAEVARDETSLALILRQHSCPYYELAETDPAISLSNVKCWRRFWAGAYGSASAGSMAIAPVTFRPSHRPLSWRSRVSPGRYEESGPAPGRPATPKWREFGKNRHARIEYALAFARRAKDQIESFNEDVDLYRVID